MSNRKREEKSINELISKSKKQSKELSDVIERVSKSNSAVAMGETSFNPPILNQILNSHRSLNEANTKLLEQSKDLASLKKGIYILIGEVSVFIAVFIATLF